MAAPVTVGSLAGVATSVLLVVLAVALLRRGADQRAARVFAYLLLLLAVVQFPRGHAGDLGGPTMLSAWGWGVAYAAFAVPFLLLYFAVLFPRPRGWLGTSRWGPWVVVGAILAVEVLYLADHSLYLAGPRLAVVDGVVQDPPVSRERGPLGLLSFAVLPVSACVAWLFARDFVRAGPGARRGALLLVSLAFAMAPLYMGTRTVLYDLLGLEAPSQPGLLGYLVTRQLQVAAYLALPFCLLMVAELLRVARGTLGAEARALARRALAVAAAPVAAAAFVSAVYVVSPRTIPLISGAFPGLFDLALPVLVSYALLRYRIFDLDLQVKASLRQGTVVGAFVGLFVVVSEGSRPVLGDHSAPYLGLASVAVLLLMALGPVQRLGARLADLALPGVDPNPAYLERRKLEVYRAALEQAVQPGAPLGPREAAMLASLRAQLGVSDRDHAFVELTVRAAGGPLARPLPAPGELMLGRYRVLHQLGAGAHGTTFLAEDGGGRQVVVKALRPDLTAEGAVREANALREVRHPHVVALEEVVELGGQAFLVMEFVGGGSLRDRLEQGPLAPAEVARVGRGLLEGLAAVHAAGVVHRDVKPSNVLLTRDGEVKLADFGVAHLPGSETTMGGHRDPASAVGTIRYMSPEQARGRRVTERGDVFSAAATLYEAWTGKPYLGARPGESAVELQMRAAGAGEFHGRLPGAPKALRAWFAHALHPDPARRFASAGEAAEAFARALPGPARSTSADGPRR